MSVADNRQALDRDQRHIQQVQQNQQDDQVIEKHAVFSAKTDNAKLVSNILGTLSTKKDTQVASITITADAISVIVEESKSFQGLTRIPANEFFLEFLFNPDPAQAAGQQQSDDRSSESFRINYNTLMECLNIYGAHAEHVSLQLLYEGYGNPLVLR